MGRPHGPQQLRAFLRRLKEGAASPETFSVEAAAINDAASAARAWAALIAHPQAPSSTDWIDRMIGSLDRIQREAQIAEVVPEVLKQVGAQVDPPALDRILAPLLDLPNGEALSHGLRRAAKTAPAPARQRLFERALQHSGQAKEDAKAVLRAAFTRPDDLEQAPDWHHRVEQVEDLELRIRLHAFLHHQIAALDVHHPVAVQSFDAAMAGLRATIGQGDPAERADLWRTVARDAAPPLTLEPLHELALEEPPVMRADALLSIGAQADRHGDIPLARTAFDAAAAAIDKISGPDHERLVRKLETAIARLGGGAPKPAASMKPAQQGVPDATQLVADLPAATGHALALCNTYGGGVKTNHFRTIARAAPLAAAFGIDLVLLDFPAPLEELVRRTANETRIGGRPWIVALHEAGRLHEASVEANEDAMWTHYRWIATSEHAPADRRADLDRLVHEGPVCLVMGVGPKGLPDRLRRACVAEYEITGSGIGLETATAMGILADRLQQAVQVVHKSSGRGG